MRRLIVISAGLLAGCGHDVEKPVSLVDKADSYIASQLAEEHPSRAPMLLYAQALDTALTARPGRDLDLAIHQSMIAESCVGVLTPGHAATEVRNEVRTILTSTPQREAAYRRYVIRSTYMVLDRASQGHCELI